MTTDNTPDLIVDLSNQLYALCASGAEQWQIDQLLGGMTTEQQALVAIYVRQKRLDIEQQMERAVAPLKGVQEQIEAAFLAAMNSSGETNRSGTGWRATITTRDNASMPDAGAFYNFLSQTGRFDMLQKRLSASVVREYFDETKQLPPGVQLSPTRVVTFYRK